MKATPLISASALAAIALLVAAFSQSSSRVQARSQLDGIWEYMVPGVRGQSVFVNGHFVHFWQRADTTLPAGPLSDSTRAAFFNSLLLIAGKFTLKDTIVTATIEYSKNPRGVGSVLRWTFSIHGDTIDYRVRNDSGRVTSSGRARRVSAVR